MNTVSLLTDRHKGFAFAKVDQRLQSIGIAKKESKILTAYIQKQFRSRYSPEDTIAFLKKSERQYLNYFARNGERVPWLATDKKGIPNNPFGLLKRKGYSNAKIIRALKIYRMFKAPDVTSSQIRKFLGSVKRPPVGTEALGEAKRLVSLALSKLAKFDVDLSFTEPDDIVSVPNYTINQWDGSLRERRYPTIDGINKPFDRKEMVIDAIRFTEFPRVNYMAPLWSSIFRPLTKSAFSEWEHRKPFRSGHPKVGIIGFKQEPGFKLRTYASPSLVAQCALTPLKRCVESILEKIPTDYTLDQDAGAAFIQSQLVSGVVYSFDLSSATDNFPLDLQLHAATTLGINPRQLLVFEKLSRADWYLAKPIRGLKTISWTVGQPLGLNGSFPLFALTHNLLLQGLEIDVYGESLKNFAVLGDDVAIADELVAIRYESLLNDLGVSISREKSIISDRLSEFAGYIIGEKFMVRPSKHRRITNKNVISYSQDYGPSMRKELNKRVPPRHDVSALEKVPKSVGGLGWATDSTLDQVLSTNITVRRLFNSLTEVKQQEELLPRKLKTSLWERVFYELGFRRQDFDPTEWQNHDILLTELGSTTVGVPPEVAYAQHYLRLQASVDQLSRKALEALASGDCEQHREVTSQSNLCLKAMKAIRYRFAPDDIDTDEIKGELYRIVELLKLIEADIRRNDLSPEAIADGLAAKAKAEAEIEAKRLEDLEFEKARKRAENELEKDRYERAQRASAFKYLEDLSTSDRSLFFKELDSVGRRFGFTFRDFQKGKQS